MDENTQGWRELIFLKLKTCQVMVPQCKIGPERKHYGLLSVGDILKKYYRLNVQLTSNTGA